MDELGNVHGHRLEWLSPGKGQEALHENSGSLGRLHCAGNKPLLTLGAELPKPQPRLKLLGGSLEGGRHLMTWSTPRGPEIDRQGQVGPRSMGVEIGGGDRDRLGGKERVLQRPQVPAPIFSRGTRLSDAQWGQETIRASVDMVSTVLC
jgi:hypothetical protein